MDRKEIIDSIIGTGLLIGIAGLTYYSCFASRTVEDVTIVKKSVYEINDSESGYYEEQNAITIEGGKCFRAPKPFGESLEVGDVIKEISYRPAPVGRCDFVTDYKR